MTTAPHRAGRPRRADETTAALRREIKAGRFQAVDALPGERQLAEWLHVSRTTLRQALAELIADGLLVQRQGMGTFIVRTTMTTPERIAEGPVDGPLVDIGLNGPIHRSAIFESGRFDPLPEEAMMFGLGPGEVVHRQSRVIFTPTGPLALERTTVPAALLRELLDDVTSLLGALAARGLRPARKLQRLRTTDLDAADAARLETGPRAMAIELDEAAFLIEGRCCAITHALYRADRFDAVFSTDLRKDAGT